MWQQIGRFGTLTEFWRIFTQVNPDSIREEAERPFRLLLVGGAGSGKTAIARALTGTPEAWARAAEVLVEIGGAAPVQPTGGNGATPDPPATAQLPALRAYDPADLPPSNLCAYVVDATRGVTAADLGAVEALRQRGRSCVVLVNKCDIATNLGALQYDAYAALSHVPPGRIAFGTATRARDVETAFATALLTALPGMQLALGRRLPALRPVVGDALIAETARVNAEFALISNLPANVPVIGGLLGGSADFVVLTKNQAMMIFKLAAIHGRDLHSKLALATEVAPVVGAAFLWRTVAREMIGMLPSLVAAVPKTAIGYVGTYVVGKIAQYYYTLDTRPTREMVKRFTADATQRWRSVAEWRMRLPSRQLWPTRYDLEKRP